VRLRIATLFTISLLPCVIFAQSPCPTTPIGSQARTTVKHRPAVTTQAQKITVADVIGWPLPGNLSDPTVRRSKQIIDPREAKVYSISGDVWIAKIECNDADYHLEMSAHGGSETDPRILVEIPMEQKAARSALIKAMKASGQGDLQTSSEVTFKQSMPLTVTGFGFIDGYHWTKLHPKVGHNHGSAAVATLWEVHPVFDLTAGDGAPVKAAAKH